MCRCWGVVVVTTRDKECTDTLLSSRVPPMKLESSCTSAATDSGKARDGKDSYMTMATRFLLLVVLVLCVGVWPGSSSATAVASKLGRVAVSGTAPVLVATATTGYLWFPQNVHVFDDNMTVLLHCQACKDEIHPNGWAGASCSRLPITFTCDPYHPSARFGTGRSFYSPDQGKTWHGLPTRPQLNKPCTSSGASTLLCLPYPLVHTNGSTSHQEAVHVQGIQNATQWIVSSTAKDDKDGSGSRSGSGSVVVHASPAPVTVQ